MSQISSTCVPSFSCLDCDYGVDSKAVDTASTLIASCSLTVASSTMVHHQRERRPKKVTTPARGRSNQLVQAVSPFEELLPREKKSHCPRDYPEDDDGDDDDVGSFPFDEILIPKVARKAAAATSASSARVTFVWDDYDVLQAREPEAQGMELRQEEPRDGIVVLVDSLPTSIAFPETPVAWKAEVESEISCETLSESRTLTPHPSFDAPKNAMTANDFHYLYQAIKQLEEQQDWPSDEDAPDPTGDCDWAEELLDRNSSFIHKNGMTMMILKDLDETVSRRDQRWSMSHCEI